MGITVRLPVDLGERMNRRFRLGIRACVGLSALVIGAQVAQAQNVAGLGVAVVPKYEGSKDYRGVPLPFVNYESGAFFIGGRGGFPGLGLRIRPAQDFSTGVYLSANLGRDSSDHSRLRGLPDVDFHGLAGAFVEYKPGRAAFSADIRQALRSSYGMTLDLAANYAIFQSHKSRITVGANTSWANHDHMDTWFGVGNAAAERSRENLRPYKASAGFKSVGISSSWTYRLTDRWSTNTTVGVKTLVGDARDSPVVERETSVFGGVGLLYAF